MSKVWVIYQDGIENPIAICDNNADAEAIVAFEVGRNLKDTWFEIVSITDLHNHVTKAL